MLFSEKGVIFHYLKMLKLLRTEHPELLELLLFLNISFKSISTPSQSCFFSSSQMLVSFTTPNKIIVNSRANCTGFALTASKVLNFDVYSWHAFPAMTGPTVYVAFPNFVQVSRRGNVFFTKKNYVVIE